MQTFWGSEHLGARLVPKGQTLTRTAVLWGVLSAFQTLCLQGPHFIHWTRLCAQFTGDNTKVSINRSQILTRPGSLCMRAVCQALTDFSTPPTGIFR